MCEYIVKIEFDDNDNPIKFNVNKKLIYCKECKYYKYDWCHRHANVVNDNDYCSYGILKELVITEDTKK